MTEARAIATREPTDLELSDNLRELENRFALATRQRELLEQYIKDRLKPEKHFYKVREGSKDSLTKEGAEVICLPHRLKPMYFIESGPDQPAEDDTPYQITSRCRLMRGESFEGEGIGSASSHVTTKDGIRQPRQGDIGLRHNATLKMAQKSAYIAATLNATAASEFFTQDMEDGLDYSKQGGPKDAKYHCGEHNTNWFKSKKMPRYAHPVGDGPWCEMPDESVANMHTRNPEVPVAATVASPTPDTIPQPPFASLAEFQQAITHTLGRDRQWVHATIGMTVGEWIDANKPGGALNWPGWDHLFAFLKTKSDEEKSAADGYVPDSTGDLFSWAWQKHRLSKAKVLEVLEVKDPKEITDLEDAWAFIEDAIYFKQQQDEQARLEQEAGKV